MKKKIFAAFTAAVMAVTATASVQGLSAAADNTQETAALNYVLSELGITDYDAFLDSLRQRVTRDNDNPLEDYVFVDLSPGDIGFPITPYDASFVLMFLNGQVDYAYDYNDMDANGDHIVDKADAEAYLECATLAMLFDDMEFTIVPHGSARTPDSARSYRRFDWATQTEDSNTYAVPVPSNNRGSSVPSDNAEYPSRVSGTYYNCTDSRIVKTSGSGVIVDNHVIATNAHCLINSSTGNFNTSFSVTAYLYPNNIPTPTTLTIVSLHIPDSYVLKDQNGNFIHKPSGEVEVNSDVDYGLIVVEEDLTSYGQFDFGLPLTGLSTSTELTAMSFPQNDGANSNMVNNHRVRPLTSYGQLYELRPHSVRHTCATDTGSSGGAIFTNTGSSGEYDSLIGIHKAGGTQWNTSVRIEQSQILFYMNNPVVQGEVNDL